MFVTAHWDIVKVYYRPSPITRRGQGGLSKHRVEKKIYIPSPNSEIIYSVLMRMMPKKYGVVYDNEII